MDPQQDLDALASSLAVIAGGGATPGALITARLSPDPGVGLVDSVAGVTRTTFLLKMLRFGDLDTATARPKPRHTMLIPTTARCC